MVNVQLEPSDASFLADQLTRQLERLQVELAHTENRAMQHALAQDVDRLQALRERIAGAVNADSAGPRFLNG